MNIQIYARSSQTFRSSFREGGSGFANKQRLVSSTRGILISTRKKRYFSIFSASGNFNLKFREEGRGGSESAHTFIIHLSSYILTSSYSLPLIHLFLQETELRVQTQDSKKGRFLLLELFCFLCVRDEEEMAEGDE